MDKVYWSEICIINNSIQRIKEEYENELNNLIYQESLLNKSISRDDSITCRLKIEKVREKLVYWDTRRNSEFEKLCNITELYEKELMTSKLEDYKEKGNNRYLSQ